MSKIRATTFHSTLPTLAALSFALVLPSAALADTGRSFDARYKGPALDMQASKSTKTRAQVLQELKQAQADPYYRAMQRDTLPPSAAAASIKTRAEVVNELKNITPEERERMKALYIGG